MVDNFTDPAPQKPAEPDTASDGIDFGANEFEGFTWGPSPVGVYEPHDIVDLPIYEDLDPRDDYLQYEGVLPGSSYEDCVQYIVACNLPDDMLGDPFSGL